MLINKQKLTNTLSRVREIKYAYGLRFIASDSVERSVNSLLELCRTYLEKKIDWYEHSDSALNHYVQSFVVVKNDGYEICTLGDLNNCWKRFVLCKEIFHIILDSEGDWNSSLEDHLSNFYGGITELECPVPASAQAELLAEIAAMEFLFPYVERIETLKQENVDYSTVAERYKIPRYFAERYLTRAYIENLRAFYE